MNIFKLFETYASNEEIIEAINKLDNINIKNKYGLTPLHYTCSFGNFEIAKYLIEHIADVNVKTDDGWTPLFYACCHGRLEIVKFLIEHGVDVNTKDKYGLTPLFLACRYGNFEVVKFLIEHGVDIQNELKICFKYKNIDEIKLLTKLGACFL